MDVLPIHAFLDNLVLDVVWPLILIATIVQYWTGNRPRRRLYRMLTLCSVWLSFISIRISGASSGTVGAVTDWLSLFLLILAVVTGILWILGRRKMWRAKPSGWSD